MGPQHYLYLTFVYSNYGTRTVSAINHDLVPKKNLFFAYKIFLNYGATVSLSLQI